MFRRNLPRCKLSRRQHLLDSACFDAMVLVERFLATMADELGAILGSVGVNDSMSHLLKSAARCWDWSRLVFDRPGADDVRALTAVAESLAPCRQHTMFPYEDAFRAVAHRWPSVAKVCEQYMVLCYRVRRAAVAARGSAPSSSVPAAVRAEATTWVRASCCEVTPTILR